MPIEAPKAVSAEHQEVALDPRTPAERPHGPALRIVSEGDLDVRSAPDLRRDVSRALDGAPGDVELDLSQVTFIDSSALGALVEIKRMVEDDGRALRLVGVSRKVTRVLQLTGLDTLFFAADDLDDSRSSAL